MGENSAIFGRNPTSPLPISAITCRSKGQQERPEMSKQAMRDEAERLVKEAMERGALDLVLADWFPEPAPLHVVYPQSRHLSRRVRVFVDWLAALIAEHDGIQLRSMLPEPRQTSP